MLVGIRGRGRVQSSEGIEGNGGGRRDHGVGLRRRRFEAPRRRRWWDRLGHRRCREHRVRFRDGRSTRRLARDRRGRHAGLAVGRRRAPVESGYGNGGGGTRTDPSSFVLAGGRRCRGCDRLPRADRGAGHCLGRRRGAVVRSGRASRGGRVCVHGRSGRCGGQLVNTRAGGKRVDTASWRSDGLCPASSMGQPNTLR